MSYWCFDLGLVRMLGWGAHTILGKVLPRARKCPRVSCGVEPFLPTMVSSPHDWQETLCSCLSCPPGRALSRRFQAGLLPLPPGGLLDPPRKSSLSPGYWGWSRPGWELGRAAYLDGNGDNLVGQILVQQADGCGQELQSAGVCFVGINAIQQFKVHDEDVPLLQEVRGNTSKSGSVWDRPRNWAQWEG